MRKTENIYKLSYRLYGEKGNREMRVAVIGVRTVGNVVKDEYMIYNFVQSIKEDIQRNCYLLSFGSNCEEGILVSKENFKIVLL